MQFMGYRRLDGKVGVRNHVVVVSTVFCSSTVAAKIASATDTVAITHEHGCLELGPDMEHTERVLHGVVRHPNVGAVLVVGLGCRTTPCSTRSVCSISSPNSKHPRS